MFILYPVLVVLAFLVITALILNRDYQMVIVSLEFRGEDYQTSTVWMRPWLGKGPKVRIARIVQDLRASTTTLFWRDTSVQVPQEDDINQAMALVGKECGIEIPSLPHPRRGYQGKRNPFKDCASLHLVRRGTMSRLDYPHRNSDAARAS